MKLDIKISTRKHSYCQLIGNTWFLDINEDLSRIDTLTEIQKQLASILYDNKRPTCPECGEFEAYCECNEEKTIPTPIEDKNTGIYNYL